MPSGIQIDGIAELRAALVAADSTLVRGLDDALADAAKIVASRAQGRAAVSSGRMRRSITPVSEGATAEVRVTARRVSRGYPGGFPYPVRIERSQPFLAPAIVQEAPRIQERMEKVLADIASKWGGA